MSLSPHEFPQFFSRHLLGTRMSPGAVTFSGHNREESWDVQAPKDQSGGTSVLKGRAVGSFQAQYQLTDQEDFDQWEDFQRLIESTTSGPEPFALPIFHPDLAANGFYEVSNGGVGGIVRDSKGGGIVLVKYIEYAPPKPKPATTATAKPATAAGSGSAGEQPYDPNRDARRELEGLVYDASQP